MEENNRSNRKVSHQLQNVLAAMLGVQSSEKHRTDAQYWTLKRSIFWGIGAILIFVLLLLVVVNGVLYSQL